MCVRAGRLSELFGFFRWLYHSQSLSIELLTVKQTCINQVTRRACEIHKQNIQSPLFPLQDKPESAI